MRPWTSDLYTESRDNPALHRLGECIRDNGVVKPIWLLYDPDNAHEESGQPCKRLRTEVGAAGEDCGDKHSELADCVRPPAKKPAEAQCVEVCRSYASSREAYIQGNVVSESSRRFISNLLMATAACRSEQQGDSSDDSDAEPWSYLNTTTGNMQVLEKIF